MSNVRKFVKKPVVVEAIQLTDNIEVFDELVNFCKPRVFNMELGKGKAYCVIETLEGAQRAEIGDWIIKGIKGECYPCKPDIFEATYNEIDN